jgi:hypothetical protein
VRVSKSAVSVSATALSASLIALSTPANAGMVDGFPHHWGINPHYSVGLPYTPPGATWGINPRYSIGLLGQPSLFGISPQWGFNSPFNVPSPAGGHPQAAPITVPFNTTPGTLAGIGLIAVPVWGINP